MPARFRAPVLGAVALVAALLVAGCGRPVGTVTGKVTYLGKALKGGNVSFVSTEGGPSFASGISAEGTYRVPDIRGGAYKVCVETASLKPPPPTPGVLGVPKAALKGGGAPPGVTVPEGYTPSDPAAMKAAGASKRYTEIPPKYAEPGTTDVEYTYTGGTQTFDIDLK